MSNIENLHWLYKQLNAEAEEQGIGQGSEGARYCLAAADEIESLRQQLAAANVLIAEQNKLAKERQEWALHTNEVIGKLKQQLADSQKREAYAIATCKLKDEALQEVSDLIGESSGIYGLHLNGDVSPREEIEQGGRFERLASLPNALAIQPDDSALKAWLGEPVARTLKRIGEEQYQPKFWMVARTYAELPKGSYPDTWQELDELYSPKGLVEK